MVETDGFRHWLAHEERTADLEEFAAARLHEREMAELMVATRRRLAALYASPLAPEEMRADKAAEFERLRAALEAGGHPAKGDINNARLVAVATYERCVPALKAELERLGGDLPAFYAAMTRLVNDAPGRAKLCPPG